MSQPWNQLLVSQCLDLSDNEEMISSVLKLGNMVRQIIFFFFLHSFLFVRLPSFVNREHLYINSIDQTI